MERRTTRVLMAAMTKGAVQRSVSTSRRGPAWSPRSRPRGAPAGLRRVGIAEGAADLGVARVLQDAQHAGDGAAAGAAAHLHHAVVRLGELQALPGRCSWSTKTPRSEGIESKPQHGHEARPGGGGALVVGVDGGADEGGLAGEVAVVDAAARRRRRRAGGRSARTGPRWCRPRGCGAPWRRRRRGRGCRRRPAGAPRRQGGGRRPRRGCAPACPGCGRRAPSAARGASSPGTRRPGAR